MIIDLQTQKDFDASVTQSDKISIVDFWAEWCGPCRAIHPIIEELSNEYKDMNFFQVNVDKFQALASKHVVFAIPTLIIFKGDQVLARMQGASSKGSYKRTIDGILK